MTVPMWSLVSRGRPLTSMQAKKKKKKLFHLSRFISRLFLFLLNSSIHACWTEDEMTCYDGWNTGTALMQLCHITFWSEIVCLNQSEYCYYNENEQQLKLLAFQAVSKSTRDSQSVAVSSETQVLIHSVALFIPILDVICRNLNSFRFIAFFSVGNNQ